jgi:hypothetical protein
MSVLTFSACLREFGRRRPRPSRPVRGSVRRASPFACRPGLEFLERRLTPTGNIVLTDASLVNSSDQPLTNVSAGQDVWGQADFTTEGLPSDASYRVAYTVNGLTLDSGYITLGAGGSGKQSWYEYRVYFIASPGANQVTVDVDPDQSVPETSYADNTMSFSFTAATPSVGNLSYTVSQIRAAYGIGSIPNFGTATADGTGQTIAIVDNYNDPSIITDLDGFDQMMNLTTNSSPTLYQQYAPASTVLTVFDETGTNITSEIANSGEDGVPTVDPTGAWEREETLDVEWAHAIAPGAHIDLIECDGDSGGIFIGAATAADLPGVTVVSMSVLVPDLSSGAEQGYDSITFVTPSGHPGVTFLAASGDSGIPGSYPAFSPNVVAVGATQLAMNGDAYGSEIGWSFPTPRTLNNGSSSYSQSGSWTSESGGFSGNYSTATAGSDSSATWTTSISSSDQGKDGAVEVSATWVANPDNATNASYQIFDGTATTGTLLGTVTVNQTIAPTGTDDGGTLFQDLGDFYPQSGTLTVVLSANSANGTVVADAVGIAPARASGGGQSPYELEPSYQLSVQSTGYRTTPDVSFDGSDQTGVTCYQNGAVGYDYSGTSLATPCFAGLIAIVNQGRAAEGGLSLNSPSNPIQTLQALYSLPASDFHDITIGYNGLSAGPGYDEVTGLGSPIANLLVPDLVSYDLAAQVAITIQPPASVTAGSAFGLTVTVENSSGDVATNYIGSVTISLDDNPGDGTLEGTLTVPVVDGVATFSGLTLDAAGTGYTIEATNGYVPSVTSSAFDVTPAAASQLVVTSEPPSSVTAGIGFGLVIDVEDAYDNVLTTLGGSVTIALDDDPGGDTLGGTLTATVVDGVATFAGLSLSKAALGYTIQASGDNLPLVITDAFDVVAAAAAQVAVTTQPLASVTAGSSFGLSVTVEDAFDNPVRNYVGSVSVALSSNPGGGSLGGSLSATVTQGVADFSGLILDKAGTDYTLTLQASSGNLPVAATTSFNVVAAAAAQLDVTTQPPTSVTAGSGFGLSVTIADPYGNPVASDDTGVSIALASNPGGATLGGTLTASAVNGMAVFSGLVLDVAATGYTIHLISGDFPLATSNPVTVTTAAAAQLMVTVQPSTTATAGRAFGTQPVIEEEDQYGNLETGDDSTVVTAALSSGTGPLQGVTTATVSGGVATFSNLVDDRAETIALAFTSGSLAAATSGAIVVSPAAASQLVIQSPQSSTATAGQPFATQPVIAEEDPYGNLETGDDSTVITAAINSGAGPLQGTTRVAVSGGVATFTDLGDDKAGPLSLLFSSGSLIPVSSEETVVAPAAASQLVVQTQASSTATAGQAFAVQPVIAEEDPYGNVVTSDDSTIVTATISGGGPLQGAAGVTVSSGVATFVGLAEDKAGPITLDFSSGVLMTATYEAIVVSPAAPSRLVIRTQPSATATAGQAFATQPVIAEEDQYGNLETGDNTTVVAVATTGGSTPLQGATNATVTGGVATFSGLAEDKAETITLGFTSGDLARATAGPVTIVPAAPATLAVTNQPPSIVTAGAGFGLVVTTEDRFGNVVPSFDGSLVVALTNNSTGGTLSGTLTATAVDGVASFSGLTLDTAADGYALQASGPGLTAAVTSAIDVTPAPATQLVVTSEPPSTVAPDSGFGLVVAVEDPFGNVVTSEGGNVTVSLANGGGGALGGTATATFVDGIATLSGLTLSGAGGYALQISGNGLSAAVSSSLTVTSPPTIVGEQVLTSGKGKHKKLSGFEQFFNAALAASRAQDAANYTATETVKHGRKSSVKAVGIQAIYEGTTRSVSLMLVGKAPFTDGGQIIVNASGPGGITDTSGTALDGNDEGVPGDDAVLIVLPKGRGVDR